MLRLTLTLIPRGDERNAREIGTVEIENDQTGTEQLGNYRVRMRGAIQRDRELRGVIRVMGLWYVAYLALQEVLCDD